MSDNKPIPRFTLLCVVRMEYNIPIKGIVGIRFFTISDATIHIYTIRVVCI